MGIRRIPGTGIRWNYCHGLPALLAAIVFVAIVLGLWQFVYRGDVVSYGDPAKVRFSQASATEGDTVEFCLGDVVWKRLCPSLLVTHLTPAKGPRLDLTTYRINVPYTIDKALPDGSTVKIATPLPHRVPPKCRAWKVPELGPDRSAGPAVLSGYAESECSPLDYWRPIITPLPGAMITINKR